MHPVSFEVRAIEGTARAGLATTAHGTYTTPCFMPVGTRGAVRYLSAVDYEDLGAQIVLGNTYHLMLRPGADTVEALGGLGKFASWGGLTLTDSGGFQVFSLEPKVDDDGVTFKSTYDGSLHRYTPETAVEVQQKLGATIQMVLDVCPPLPSEPHVVELALKRTSMWAQRAREHHSRTDQALFGIVQGGINPELRARSALSTAALEFDGYGIGGLSVGESREEMLPALAAALQNLPTDRPRYLMGVGQPRDIIAAVSTGIDMFDCVLPTRCGRNSLVYTFDGQLRLRNAQHATDPRPLEADCPCLACRHSRSYLRHLFLAGEMLGPILASIHNLTFYQRLVARLREGVLAGRFDAVCRELLARLETAPDPAG